MAHGNQFDVLALECAKAIRDAFNEYNFEFRLITQRAPAPLRKPRLERKPARFSRAN